MSRSLHAVILTAVLLSAATSGCTRGEPDTGFWFDQVSFKSARLGGALTPADLRRIDAVARAELARAFAGLRVRLSDHRDARYRVRVVQQLQDLRYGYARGGPAGESHAVPGFGGSGALDFSLLADFAVVYAPANADRAAIVTAIGRGVGQAAVHEFIHQLLPTSPVMDGRDDALSYEYAYAGRASQSYGELHWGAARPLLQKRFGG